MAGAGFDGVEVGEGEFEHAGEVFEGEVVFQSEDAEALAEVVGREADEAEPGFAEVGDVFAAELVVGLSAGV